MLALIQLFELKASLTGLAADAADAADAATAATAATAAATAEAPPQPLPPPPLPPWQRRRCRRPLGGGRSEAGRGDVRRAARPGPPYLDLRSGPARPTILGSAARPGPVRRTGMLPYGAHSSSGASGCSRRRPAFRLRPADPPRVKGCARPVPGRSHGRRARCWPSSAVRLTVAAPGRRLHSRQAQSVTRRNLNWTGVPDRDSPSLTQPEDHAQPRLG